jgi:parallel beta-helix repeat protein
VRATLATWNDPLNTAGVSVNASGRAEIRNNTFTGNRTAIDINNSTGNVVRNNVIDDNRTGLILWNTTDNTVVTENQITNNWALGVLLIDGSGGTNVPPQRSTGSTFTNNNISGNWYGGIVDRHAGGSLPAPGTNLKNFSGYWFGTTSPVVSTGDSGEPGYAALIPVEFGGIEVPPAGAPDVSGAGSDNIDVTPFLDSGVDTSAVHGFQEATPRSRSQRPVPRPAPSPACKKASTWSILVESCGLSPGPIQRSFPCRSARTSA